MNKLVMIFFISEFLLLFIISILLYIGTHESVYMQMCMWFLLCVVMSYGLLYDIGEGKKGE